MRTDPEPDPDDRPPVTRAASGEIFELHVDESVAPRSLLQSVLELAVEIAREGREGRRIGTLFTIGDEADVLRRSRCLILDPLAGHTPEHRRLDDADLRETVKELAQLDGGFVVAGSGHVVSAARYFETSLTDHQLPLGLGSRHLAAASITRHTRALAVVVSESSVVRVFADGKLKTEILPELWLLRRYSPHVLRPRYTEHLADNIGVVSGE